MRSKVGKRAKAMSLAFVLLDLHYARIKQRVKGTEQSLDT